MTSKASVTGTSLWARWDRWWMRQGPPHLLSLFRIIFGGFLLGTFLVQFPTLALRYSTDGLLLPKVEDPSFLPSLFHPTPATAAFLFASFLISLLLFTLGAWTRISAGVAFLLYAYYWILSLHQFGTSFDRLFLFSMLVLTPSGSGETLSIDAWRRYGSIFAWRPISILPQRLLSAQITATYLGVGWQKIVLPAWQSGEVLSYGFVGRWATPFATWLIRMNPPMWIFDLSVFMTKCFEVAIPFGLWSKKCRWWFFAGGAFFHTSITLILGIWWFQALIPAYILFFEPEEVHAWLRRMSRRIPARPAL